MDKTINVAVRLERMHPKYGIRLRDTRKYMAHDEEQVARVGDLVRIEEGRKRSKNKAFELREVLRAAPRFDGSQFENTPFAAGRLVQPPAGRSSSCLCTLARCSSRGEKCSFFISARIESEYPPSHP